MSLLALQNTDTQCLIQFHHSANRVPSPASTTVITAFLALIIAPVAELVWVAELEEEEEVAVVVPDACGVALLAG